MSFEWDEDKNRANLLKHGISFEEAELISGDRYFRVLTFASTTARCGS